ncbi:hypothetical protein CKM354_000870100 [Cercospora kikuchii]|uniref:CCD97-like C-terminal domain-containing protein n=1 Tax=Cercospora kikuchii TaxID=84275 RepID=A0A9P3FJK4_9PEZI|nr:uncharacterized protein CKM354_000870100 [Cercospora kikuchii]GIZ45539.1 hypothetical protein CKM354_000870100 [Cercospora kikuchii]
MPHFPEEEERQRSPQHSLAIRSATQQKQDETLSSGSLVSTRRVAQYEDLSTTPTRILIKNRRKRYLDLHPSYFTSSDLELADPILYDRLVRQHLSAQERETQGRERGFTGVLEADLMRSEAKLNALAVKREEKEKEDERRKGRELERVRRQREEVVRMGRVEGECGDGVDGESEEEGEDDEYEGLDRDAAWSLWKDIMTQRFLAGEDGDFEYGVLVDGNEELDDWEEEERGKLEEWLEKEEEEFLPGGDGERRELKGETGVQDF